MADKPVIVSTDARPRILVDIPNQTVQVNNEVTFVDEETGATEHWNLQRAGAIELEESQNARRGKFYFWFITIAFGLAALITLLEKLFN